MKKLAIAFTITIVISLILGIDPTAFVSVIATAWILIAAFMLMILRKLPNKFFRVLLFLLGVPSVLRFAWNATIGVSIVPIPSIWLSPATLIALSVALVSSITISFVYVRKRLTQKAGKAVSDNLNIRRPIAPLPKNDDEEF